MLQAINRSVCSGRTELANSVQPPFENVRFEDRAVRVLCMICRVIREMMILMCDIFVFFDIMCEKKEKSGDQNLRACFGAFLIRLACGGSSGSTASHNCGSCCGVWLDHEVHLSPLDWTLPGIC